MRLQHRVGCEPSGGWVCMAALYGLGGGGRSGEQRVHLDQSVVLQSVMDKCTGVCVSIGPCSGMLVANHSRWHAPIWELGGLASARNSCIVLPPLAEERRIVGGGCCVCVSPYPHSVRGVRAVRALCPVGGSSAGAGRLHMPMAAWH
jgi:hypothetical protein